MNQKIVLNKEQLEEMYVVRHLSMQEIAKLFNVSITHVYTYMHKYGIQARNCGRPRTNITEGKKYGHLTALSFSHISKKGHQMWLCECDCESHTHLLVAASSLSSGHTTSCGCTSHKGNTKHNLSNNRIYKVYMDMIARCYNPNEKCYVRYGARGITVCDEWKDDFCSFAEWSFNNGYDDSLTIDRIDNSKGYSPDNCRWATMKQQQNNRTNNRIIDFNGEKHTLSEWANITGLSADRISARLDKLGWTLERALTQDSKMTRKGQ